MSDSARPTVAVSASVRAGALGDALGSGHEALARGDWARRRDRVRPTHGIT